MAGDIVHDEAMNRFLLDRDGLVSYLSYQRLDQRTVEFVTTWVHPGLRGRGVGARLVEHALLWAEERGDKVVPSCWFVAEFIERTGRFRPLLAGDMADPGDGRG